MLGSIDTLSGEIITNVAILGGDSVWLVSDICHTGFRSSLGVVGVMFVVGFVGLGMCYRKHNVAKGLAAIAKRAKEVKKENKRRIVI